MKGGKAEKQTLESFEYKDPLEVLIVKENRKCKGCCHEFKASGFGVTMMVCMKLDQAGRRRRHGERCKDFRERQ